MLSSFTVMPMRTFLCFFLLWTTFVIADEEPYKKITEKKLFNGDTLIEYRLKNGLRVLHVPRHQAEVLTYQIWFDVGSVDEKLDPKLKKTGLAHLFEHMMFRGTERVPDGKFDEIISRMGGVSQNATTWFHRTNYFESIPAQQLEKLMAVESDRMQNLKIEGPLFEKEKGAVVGELRKSMDSPSTAAFWELEKLAFTKSPYRYTVIGNEKEIVGFTLDEANYFYKTFYAPNNAVLIVSGAVDSGKLMDLVEKYYGEMKPQPVPKLPVTEEPAQKKERRISITHPQATSEILLVGYRIPPIHSADTAALSLLSAHLSSGNEARLQKLLVDTGIAVSANASPSHKPDLMEFFVSLSEKNSAQKALNIIDSEIRSLQRIEISKEAFDRALNQERLDLYSQMSSNSSLANILGEYLMNSGNYMKAFELLEAYQSLTPADLQQAARNHLNQAQRSIVIVKPSRGGGKKA